MNLRKENDCLIVKNTIDSSKKQEKKIKKNQKA